MDKTYREWMEYYKAKYRCDIIDDDGTMNKLLELDMLDEPIDEACAHSLFIRNTLIFRESMPEELAQEIF